MASDWNRWEYKCPKCSFGCSSEKLLNQHIEDKHSEKKLEDEKIPKKDVGPINPYKNLYLWR